MRGIVYIHVPKCGGSSFGAALRLRYALSQATIPLGLGDPTLPEMARTLSDYSNRDLVLQHLLQRKIRCIAGHVRYDAGLHALSGYHFVTLLRDPAQRFVSHYRYLQRRHPDPARADTLDAFVESPEARHIAAQYLFYFARESLDSCRNLGSALVRARRNLSRFALIGDLSDPAGFARGLRHLTGLPLPVLHRNRAPTRPELPTALWRRIDKLTAADRAIYDAARSLRQAA